MSARATLREALANEADRFLAEQGQAIRSKTSPLRYLLADFALLMLGDQEPELTTVERKGKP